jgi:hypothetical protein
MEGKEPALEQHLGSAAQRVDGADAITTTVVAASDEGQRLIAAQRQR